MAKLISQFPFIGSLGDVSAYKMRGVDHIILRTKGGPSAEQIKNAPEMERTRENNKEFGGRATAAKWIMHALWPSKALADHNIAGPLNALLRPVQQLDNSSRRGTRHVLLSRNPRMLEGFSLNKQYLFDSIIRTAVHWSVSRDTCAAHADIPALLPGVNFFASERFPMFRIEAVLGLVPDIMYDASKYKPASGGYGINNFQYTRTEWQPVLKGAPAAALDIQLQKLPPDQSFTLVLSIGICYGVMENAGTVKQVKHVGSAKILGAV